jgi:hypothetical protein
VGVDNIGFYMNGERWLPVMGEIEYARMPCRVWREELMRAKAGGITIVSTYIMSVKQ